MEAYSHLAAVYDKLMDDVDYDAWAAYIDGLIGVKNAAVYEAACGTGSLSYRLCQKGHKVIAADASQAMLRIAAGKARSSGCAVTFALQDMREVQTGNAVDAVVSACDGPNYIDESGLFRFAQSAYAALKQNGVLLFDISTRTKLSGLGGQVCFDDDDDLTCIWQNIYNPDAQTLDIDVTLFMREGSVFIKHCETHKQHAHGVKDAARIMQQAGFSQVEVYECFSLLPCTEKTQRAQFVCRK